MQIAIFIFSIKISVGKTLELRTTKKNWPAKWKCKAKLILTFLQPPFEEGGNNLLHEHAYPTLMGPSRFLQHILGARLQYNTLSM